MYVRVVETSTYLAITELRPSPESIVRHLAPHDWTTLLAYNWQQPVNNLVIISPTFRHTNADHMMYLLL
jgi:hypothetical protein